MIAVRCASPYVFRRRTCAWVLSIRANGPWKAKIKAAVDAMAASLKEYEEGLEKQAWKRMPNRTTLHLHQEEEMQHSELFRVFKDMRIAEKSQAYWQPAKRKCKNYARTSGKNLVITVSAQT